MNEPRYVYILEATGVDFLTCSSYRTIRTTTCFTSSELAEQRIGRFREKLVSGERPTFLDDDNLKIEIVPLEIVE